MTVLLQGLQNSIEAPSYFLGGSAVAKWFARGELVFFFFNKVISRIRGMDCHYLKFPLAQFHPRDKVFGPPKDVGYKAPIEEGGYPAIPC